MVERVEAEHGQRKTGKAQNNLKLFKSDHIYNERTIYTMNRLYMRRVEWLYIIVVDVTSQSESEVGGIQQI